MKSVLKNNDQARMTNDEGSPNAQIDENSECSLRHLDLVIFSSLDIRHSSFSVQFA
jgi:hypothetical protein